MHDVRLFFENLHLYMFFTLEDNSYLTACANLLSTENWLWATLFFSYSTPPEDQADGS